VIDIPVVIPWRSDNKVAKAYDDIMAQIQDWCLILDHDVLMLNPEWYRICCRAAETLGKTSGWISGRTSANATLSPTQMDFEAPRNHDIMAHMRHAKKIYQRLGEQIIRFDNGTVMSGFMILTNRWTWEKVGGFDERAADSYYHYDMIKHGIDAHILPGLYMYHLHHNKKAWHQF
jgi:GT2 family glycosyltransferase